MDRATQGVINWPAKCTTTDRYAESDEAFVCCACEAARFTRRRCNEHSVVVCIDLLTALSATGHLDEIFKVQHFGQSPGEVPLFVELPKFPYNAM